MRYKEKGNDVQITFTQYEYDYFLFSIGRIAENTSKEDRYLLLSFLDDMNHENPNWKPYTLEYKEMRKKKK